MNQQSAWIGVFEAARIAGRCPNHLRRCDAVLSPVWICGRRMYHRTIVERWAGQLEAARLARKAKKAKKA